MPRKAEIAEKLASAPVRSPVEVDPSSSASPAPRAKLSRKLPYRPRLQFRRTVRFTEESESASNSATPSVQSQQQLDLEPPIAALEYLIQKSRPLKTSLKRPNSAVVSSGKGVPARKPSCKECLRHKLYSCSVHDACLEEIYSSKSSTSTTLSTTELGKHAVKNHGLSNPSSSNPRPAESQSQSPIPRHRSALPKRFIKSIGFKCFDAGFPLHPFVPCTLPSTDYEIEGMRRLMINTLEERCYAASPRVMQSGHQAPALRLAYLRKLVWSCVRPKPWGSEDGPPAPVSDVVANETRWPRGQKGGQSGLLVTDGEDVQSVDTIHSQKAHRQKRVKEGKQRQQGQREKGGKPVPQSQRSLRRNRSRALKILQRTIASLPCRLQVIIMAYLDQPHAQQHVNFQHLLRGQLGQCNLGIGEMAFPVGVAVLDFVLDLEEDERRTLWENMAIGLGLAEEGDWKRNRDSDRDKSGEEAVRARTTALMNGNFGKVEGVKEKMKKLKAGDDPGVHNGVKPDTIASPMTVLKEAEQNVRQATIVFHQLRELLAKDTLQVSRNRDSGYHSADVDDGRNWSIYALTDGDKEEKGCETVSDKEVCKEADEWAAFEGPLDENCQDVEVSEDWEIGKNGVIVQDEEEVWL